MLTAPRGFPQLPVGQGSICRGEQGLTQRASFLRGSPAPWSGASGFLHPWQTLHSHQGPIPASRTIQPATETLILWKMTTPWWISQGFIATHLNTPIFLLFLWSVTSTRFQYLQLHSSQQMPGVLH